MNAEDDKEIFFVGHTFRFKPRGRKSGTHELAEALGTIDGKISYPTLVILNPQNEIIFQYSGYMKREGLLSVFVQLLIDNKLYANLKKSHSGLRPPLCYRKNLHLSL